MKLKLILGSASPRRKELLGHLKIPFKISTSDVEEVSHHEEPALFAEDIARLKGSDVFNREVENDPNCFVISSDTVVVLNGKIYGKPENDNHAREILSELSGNTHQVITAVAFYFKDPKTSKTVSISFHQKTNVTFAKIDDDLMDLYIAEGEGRDKAGSYGIQGMGLTFIKEINGSYSNVVGFPLELLIQELRKVTENYFEVDSYRDIF
jgi:septum formation protein